MADFDAIIIGAGHNGLVCACHLLRAGWRVAVLESAAEIGGGLRSDVSTLPGFIHDRYATNLSLFEASPAYRELKPGLDALGVKFLGAAAPYASVHQNQAIRVFTDLDRTVAGLGSISAADAQGWIDIVRFYKRVSPSIQPFFYTEMPSPAALRKAGEMLVRNSPADVWRLAKLFSQSSTSFARTFLQSPGVVSVFQAWAYHLDFPPDKAGGALFAFISAMAAHVHGMQLVEGGAGKISSGLRSLIERSGGTVWTNSEVRRIVVRNGRAVSVRLADGQELTAGRAIVANVTTRNLFGRIIDPADTSNDLLKRARAFRYGPGTFIIHLALKRAPIWKAGRDLGDFSYLHLNGSEAEIRETYASSVTGKLPVRPLLVVSQTTQIDPSRAPAGNHVMRIHVRTVPGEIIGDAADEIKARDWRAAKEQFAERILGLVVEAAPDLRECVIGKAIETPAEIESENPNFVGGDCVSGSHHLAQNFFMRPFFGWSNYRTPIDALFMIGASTWPGGGINGASGYLVARQLAPIANS